MHHRVKNNLQQVASILRMQRRRTADPVAKQILRENIGRVYGIAATHDLLSHADELGRARLDDIARKIVGIVQANLISPELTIHFEIGPMPTKLPSEQATTFAIIVNELIANAIEHGFAGRAHGEIRLSEDQIDDWVVFRVADDGAGVPEGFDFQTANSMGLRLVRELVVKELHGDVALLREYPSEDGDAEPRGWTIAEARFPLPVTPDENEGAESPPETDDQLPHTGS
jgi:two-component sensor histidine kinase